MPMDRSKYPKDWPAISKRIREREGQRCKWCAAPNGERVARSEDGQLYMLGNGDTFWAFNGVKYGCVRGSEMAEHLGAYRFVKIVITVAHLDQDPSNNADENLAALCQKCHLAHDHGQHVANARATRRSRKAVGNLPGVE